MISNTNNNIGIYCQNKKLTIGVIRLQVLSIEPHNLHINIYFKKNLFHYLIKELLLINY